MSDLQRSFIRAKLAQAPAELVAMDAAIVQEAEHDDDSVSSASSASSAGTIKPLPSRNLFARPQVPSSRGSSLDPLYWTSYFEQELYLDHTCLEEYAVYHVYITPPAATGPLFVAHHGAGSSGLSFAALAVEIRKIFPEAGFMALDARGHGETVVKNSSGNSPILDLSLMTLTNDMVNVVSLTKDKLGWSALPAMILVGHSLGGAVVTNVAKEGTYGDKILGYAVLDVVEGSAMDALQSMQTYLSTRPSGFPSVTAGIEWHVRSRTIRNPASARVSVPALLRQTTEAQRSSHAWIWRTDLVATQPFWENWFVGLSKHFLQARGGKLLLLAGTDRLDKELMIGQMQGKYQLLVFPEAGHFIHEDAPAKTAAALVEFQKRNDRSTLVLPPKVSDMLKMKAGKEGL